MFKDVGVDAYRPGGRPDLIPHRDNTTAESVSSLTATETTTHTARARSNRDVEFKDSLADMYREQCIQV